MKKFRSITSLSFYVTDFNKQSIANRSIWKSNNIFTLEIASTNNDDAHIPNNYNDQPFKNFLIDKCMDLSNILSLTISDTIFSTQDSFFWTLSHFPHIEYLYLDNTDCNDSMPTTLTTAQQQQQTPFLEHFAFSSASEMGQKIAVLFQNNLEKMEITCNGYYNLFQNANFPNLKEIYLDSPYHRSWVDAFKSTSNLEVVILDLMIPGEYTNHRGRTRNDFDADLFELMFDEILKNQPSLEILEIAMMNPMAYRETMRYLEKALYSNRNMKRKSDRLLLTLTVIAGGDPLETQNMIKSIMFNTIKVINFLKEIFKHFAVKFIVSHWGEDQVRETLKSVVMELETLKADGNYMVDHQFVTETQFNIRISNNEFAKNND